MSDRDTALTSTTALKAISEQSVDPWLLVRRGRESAGSAQDESLLALANGTLGVRGGIEEALSPTQGCFLAGVWERTEIEYHERFSGFAKSTETRVPVADGTRIQLSLGETPVRLEQGEWLDFARVLDLRHGCLRRSLRWRAPSGITLDIQAERIVALETPGLLAIRYRVRSIDYTGPLILESAMDTSRDAMEQGADPRIGTRVNGGLQTQDAVAEESLAWIRQRTTHSGIRVVCGQRHVLPADGLRFRDAALKAHGVSQTYVGQLSPGAEVILEKYVAYAWSQPGGSELNTVLLANVDATLQQAISAGYDGLAQQQTRTLERFWRDADLAIVGDTSTELALRLNLFHVYQSTSRDSSGSVAAKGLTGEGYEGHYFWDAEAFMLPTMVGVAPELARGMLEYRYRTLGRARLHAREMDHPRGALYPWRTISGDECSA